MTIDEAIVHAREVSSRKFDDMVHCIRCSEFHEQLAEWLEELKANRIALEKANGCLEANYRLGYNKCIDDFVNACKEDILCQTFGLHQKNIERIAEQLKAGNINESN